MTNEMDDQGENENWEIRFRQDEELDFFTELALHETERWIQSVTRKKFAYPDDLRRSLENGVLLCELLNNLKPGSIKRINKLPGPIAGLDNINVFLKACKSSFGLNDTHLFDVTDLEDLSQRAISESEDILKLEQDRRSRNVAVTIYWLGRAVSGYYSGTKLDFSAFAALVNHHGKDLISTDNFHHDSWESTEQSSAYSSHESNSRGSLHDSLDKKHNRDSSYDSYGSCSNSRESELSFSLEEENMPGISMRRYGSTSSINRSGELQLPLNSEDDSLYQSTPDLANSNNHARSPSTDSMDGSYHGNHSRQSSDSVEIPTRTLSSQRKVSQSSVDPMQFVKIKSSDYMAKKAEHQIKLSQEVKKVRTTIDREEEDWQSRDSDNDWQANLSSWKTRRRKQSAATIERVEETDKLTKEKEEEEEEIKPKTYTQILAERTERRKSTGRLNFYPVEDDEDSLFSSPSPVKEDIVSSVVSRPVESTNRAPALSMKQRSSSTSESYVTYNDTAKASWAESSSDEETNQSEPKIEKMSTRLQQIEKTYTNKFSDSVKETRSTTNDSSYSRDKVSNRESPPIQKKLKTWKSENSLMNEKKMAPWKNDHKESNFGSSGNKINTGQSPGKVSNILKNFKEKEEKAKDYHNPRRSYDFKTDINSSARPSRLKNTKWNTFDTPSGSLTFSAPEKAASVLSPRSTITEKTKPVPTKAAVEKTIKISQKPNNTKGFGFTISGGADKRQPIVVQKISLGQGDTTLDGKSSAADVCEVLQNDEILTINDRDVSWLSHAQVQKLIDDAVKIGHIDLKVRRAISSDEDFEEEDDVHVTNSPKSKPEHLPTALTPRQSRGHSPANHQSTTPQRSPSESKAYTPAEGRYRSGSPMNYSPAERSYRVRSPAEGQYTPPTSRRSREASPIITRSQSPLQRSTKSPSTFNEHRQTPSKDYKAMKDTQLHTDDHLNEDIVESNNNDLKNDLIGEPSPVEDSEPPFQQVTSPPQHVELEVSRQVVTPVKQEPKPVQEELIPKVEAPVKQEVLPQTETPKHEVEITEKPVIAFRRERKTPAIESPITVQTKPKEMHEESPDKWDLPPPPPTEAPPDVPDADNEDSGVGPPAFLRRWQQKKSRPKSEYLSSSNDNKKDPEKRLSASFLLDFNRHSDDEKLPVVEPVIVQEKKKENNTEPLLMTTKATVGQPVTLEIADESEPQKNPERSQPVMVTPAFQAGQLQIDPRNLMDSSEENLPQYNFHVNINKVNLQSEPKSVVVDTTAIEREREKIREEEQKRVEEERRRWEEEEQKKLEEKAAALRKQEQKIREEEEKLRQEKERMQREREELEKSRKLQKEPEPKSFQVRQNSPTTHFSASTSHIDNNRPAPSLRKLDVSKPMMESLGTKDKTRWSRQDMLAMNRKATPLQKKPEHEETENSVSSEVSREAPSKQDLHNLNAVPKSKFRGSMDWMKPEDKELHSSIHNSAAKPVLRTEGNRGSSNFHEHWLIEEAERRRKAGSPNRHSATLPLNSSLQIKPSNSVMNRWRDDSSVPKQQTSISLQGNLSQPRTLSTTVSHNRNHDKNLASKHSYTPIQQTKVSLSQTLPHNFNSSLSPKRDQPSVLPKPMRNSSSPSASSPTSPVNQAEQFMAVSGKQCCSYCHEELGFGAAMVIESLGLYYHVQCFRCCVCHTALGNGSQGTDVRVRVNKLHCRNCYSNDEGSRRRERRSHNN